jgi:hypothetical protein
MSCKLMRYKEKLACEFPDWAITIKVASPIKIKENAPKAVGITKDFLILLDSD